MIRKPLPTICISLTLVVLFFTASVAEAKNRKVVNSSETVRDWCEKKSYKYFRKKKLTPYNWTASWWDEGNSIVVKGEWYVEQKTAVVTCSAERGRGLTGAVMEVKYEE